MDRTFPVLVGQEVEQVWVWWSLRLVFDLAGTHVDVTNFRFTDRNGVSTDVRIEDDPVAAGPVLGLLRHRVVSAGIADWELRLGFDDGASLVCPPDPRYEAWAVAIAGEETLDCPPAG